MTHVESEAKKLYEKRDMMAIYPVSYDRDLSVEQGIENESIL